VLAEYVRHVLSFIGRVPGEAVSRRARCRQRIAGLVAPPIFAQLACRTTRLCFEVDGTFPNHEANPLIEEKPPGYRRARGAERATSHRVGRRRRPVLLHRRQRGVHPGDFITALLAEAFLLKHPGARIVYDVRASYAVKDTVARLGARP